MTLESGKIRFKGSMGFLLDAKIDTPKGGAQGWALFAHCFTCTKDILAASRIARELTENGIAVLRFDFTGLGKSEGDFSNTNFSSNVADILAAAGFMRDNGCAPSILIGHSLGGTAILAAANKIPESRAVASIGAPCEAAHVLDHFQDEKAQILEKGAAKVCLTGRPFIIKRQFVEDLENSDIRNCVKNLGNALLVMHAPLDDVVGIENAAQIFKWAHHPKSYISLDNADHLITNKHDAAYAARIISCWARRYM